MTANQFDYRGVPIYIKKKPIKHMYIRIHASGCQINMSNKMSAKFVENYLKYNIEAIKKTYLKLKHMTYSILGKPISVSYSKDEYDYEFKRNHLKIAHPISFDKGFKAFLKTSMITYIQHLEAQLQSHLKSFEITPVPYRFKYLTSKFGSYHRVKHMITLNTFLYMLEPALIFYVLMHEYAHTKAFHHQQAFYDLQHRLCPNDKELSKRLKTLTIPRQFTI